MQIALVRVLPPYVRVVYLVTLPKPETVIKAAVIVLPKERVEKS